MSGKHSWCVDVKVDNTIIGYEDLYNEILHLNFDAGDADGMYDDNNDYWVDPSDVNDLLHYMMNDVTRHLLDNYYIIPKAYCDGAPPVVNLSDEDKLRYNQLSKIDKWY